MEIHKGSAQNPDFGRLGRTSPETENMSWYLKGEEDLSGNSGCWWEGRENTWHKLETGMSRVAAHMVGGRGDGGSQG